MNETQLQQIYLGKVEECLNRLKACEFFLNHIGTESIYSLESAILQMRKALECVAYAAIAPNKKKYEELRAQADECPDFRKDFNARKILKMLLRINKGFYPIPLSPAIKIGPKKWHYPEREDKSLTMKNFSSFYDRLGKFLHADNPWGNDKGIKNLIKDIPEIMESIKLLLSFHSTNISTPQFRGAWVVEVPLNGEKPNIIVGRAVGHP